MKLEKLFCDLCGGLIAKGDKQETIKPNRKKRVGYTLVLTGRSHRLWLKTDTQLRINADLYISNDDDKAEQHFHKRCIKTAVADRLRDWFAE